MSKYKSKKELLIEMNKSLKKHFNIELERYGDSYRVIKHFSDGYDLGHLPTGKPKVNKNYYYWHESDSNYRISDTNANGGTYSVRVFDHIQVDGYGEIRILINDNRNDIVWDLVCRQNDRDTLPLCKLSIRKSSKLGSRTFGTCESPVVNFNLDKNIVDPDLTGIFYYLGVPVLYTTFDKIYIKKCDKEGNTYYVEFSDTFTPRRLKEAADKVLGENLVKQLEKEFKIYTGIECTESERLVLRNFFLDRVQEFLNNMGHNRKNYAFRYKLLKKLGLIADESASDFKRPYSMRPYSKRIGA